MNYLTVEQVSKAFGDRFLFENITFYVNQGDRVALIAKNGTGKTSLLNMIAGLEEPDSGKILLHPKINVGYLPQEPEMNPQWTVFDAVYQSQSPVVQAVAHYERTLLSGDSKAIEQSMAEMDRLQAWDYELRIRQILTRLDVHYYDRKIGVLSGGQRKRVALAKLLVEQPELLILDEPTNHLDLDMIEWLEQYLTQNSITLLMVTHDRYFLDAVCLQIIELSFGQLFKYQGDYANYLIQRTEREEMQQASIEKARNLYRKELEWMRRQPQARTTKAKARIDRFFDVEKKAKQNYNEDAIQLDIKASYLGSKILEIHNVSKAYDGHLLIKNFDYKFKQQDRVGIVGKNGAGKTTLLNMLTLQEQPDSGKVVHGETLTIGYYTQDGMNMSEDKRVIDVIRDIAEFIPMNGGRKLTASQLLERFLFDHKQQQTYVSRLSGGEKRRLYLLTLLMHNPNFLILDEPTNDLDIVSLQVLEEFLVNYPGCVVVVSHDRFFMDKIVEHLFVFEGKGVISDFPGNYSSYRERLNNPTTATTTEKNTTVTAETTVKSSRELHEDRKELKKLEKTIATLQQQKQKVTERFNSENLSQQQITDLSKELKTLEEQIEEKEMEWLELADGLED